MLKSLIVAVALVLASPAISHADLAQDNIIERLTQHYDSVLRKAGSDQAKRAEIMDIYKAAVKTIRSKAGTSGIPDATKAAREMSEVVQ